MYGYDLESKLISSQWTTSSSPEPKKAWQVNFNVKTMLTAFFNIDGLILHEHIPRRQTEFYRLVLQHFHKHPEKWPTSNWILHHNAPTHVCQNKWILGETPHSFASTFSILIWTCSCDFFLSPHLKEILKSCQFSEVEEIQANVMRQMRAISQNWLPEMLL